MKEIKIVELKNLDESFKLLMKDKESKKFSCGLVVLEGRKDVGEHSTENKEEVLVFIEGKAKVLIEKKKEHIIKAPSFVYIPPETLHNVINNSSEKLKYIYITTKLNE